MNSAVLTIDDIASKNTPAIVDYLREKQITAVMFAVGENVKNYYEQAIYAIKAGMIVGNHSYSHPAFSSLSLQQGIEEIEKNEEVLNRLYKDAGVERKYRPFRFPYGDKGGANQQALQQYLRDNGFDKLTDTQIAYPWWKTEGCDKNIDTFWTFDFAEYQIRPGSAFKKEDVWKRMDNTDPAKGTPLFGKDNRHIILLHAHDETEELVPRYYAQFIDYVLEKGLIFEQPSFGIQSL